MNNLVGAIQAIGIMVLLGGCSLVAIAVVIERAFRLRRSQLLDPLIIEDIQSQIEQGRIDLAIERHAMSHSLIGRLLSRGLNEHLHTSADIETALTEAGQRSLPVLQNNLSVLSLIAKIAPLLGLLGTVLGMIMGFETLEQQGVGKENLAHAIRVALISTALGLLIAIPTLVALSWFRSKVRKLTAEVEEVLIDVIKSVKQSEMAKASPETGRAAP